MWVQNPNPLPNPLGSAGGNTSSVLRKPKFNITMDAPKSAAANESESLQMFMDALFEALRDDPAACASVDRITREMEKASAAARAGTACPTCGRPRIDSEAY